VGAFCSGLGAAGLGAGCIFFKAGLGVGVLFAAEGALGSGSFTAGVSFFVDGLRVGAAGVAPHITRMSALAGTKRCCGCGYLVCDGVSRASGVEGSGLDTLRGGEREEKSREGVEEWYVLMGRA
jgi:hypothetical protein